LQGSAGNEGRREEGFVCPWKDKGCGNERVSAEHALDDCGVDVVLGRILDVFEKVVKDFEEGQQQWSGTDVCMQWKTTTHAAAVAGETETESDGVTTHPTEEVCKSTLRAGRYLGTYLLAREGGLPYDTKDVVYEDTVSNDEENPFIQESSNNLDEIIYEQLRSGFRDELDCQVCYGLIVDPCISPCGHSFCYECANRIRDNSNLCPLCRKKMYLSFREGPDPVHAVLRCLLDAFFPGEIKSRKEAIEEDGTYDDDEIPLFICTLAFPSTPTYLHIFEPRYRLMIRRALDYGNSKFGMVIHNLYHDLAAQAHPDRPPEPFMQYGTAVRIEWRDFLPDGRIMLTAVGTHKFKVLRYGVLDGYYRAHTERVDDISLAEEENLEARELAAAANQNNQPANGSSLNALSNQELMQICMDFLEKQRTISAPAVRERVNRVFGRPPTDPAIFPYWFANVLPIPDEEAYKIIPLTSVRERLKIAATWPDMLEDSGWYALPSSSIRYVKLIQSTGQFQPPPAPSYDSSSPFS
jgi:Lon protease-like protein